MNEGQATIQCVVCKKQVPAGDRISVAAIPPGMVDLPAEAAGGRICNDCLALERLRVLTRRLQSERGELSDLEADVARRTATGATIARSLGEEFARTATRAQRVADGVARVGGSWIFVISAVLAIILWIGANALLLGRSFDPYPFILLNLVLSCLAALQAPIIMMSQNRGSARDRLQADQDFLVNLKAELEVSGLHAKLDHLLHARWEDLMLVQQLQIDLLSRIQRDVAGDRPTSGPA